MVVFEMYLEIILLSNRIISTAASNIFEILGKPRIKRYVSG